MKIVLDTNIIVSAFINPKGAPGEIISLVLSKKITICYDNRIFSEYTEVLKKSKFNFDNILVDAFLDSCRRGLIPSARSRVRASGRLKRY
jgi:putative PIN family toxin of toxin-antitoxin system